MLSAGRGVCLGRPQRGGTHTIPWTGTRGYRGRGLPSFVSIFTFVLLLILPLQGSAWPHGKTHSPLYLSLLFSSSPSTSLSPTLALTSLSLSLSLSSLPPSPPAVSLSPPQPRWLKQFSGGIEKGIPSERGTAGRQTALRIQWKQHIQRVERNSDGGGSEASVRPQQSCGCTCCCCEMLDDWLWAVLCYGLATPSGEWDPVVGVRAHGSIRGGQRRVRLKHGPGFGMAAGGMQCFRC